MPAKRCLLRRAADAQTAVTARLCWSTPDSLRRACKRHRTAPSACPTGAGSQVSGLRGKAGGRGCHRSQSSGCGTGGPGQLAFAAFHCISNRGSSSRRLMIWTTLGSTVTASMSFESMRRR